MGVLLCFAFVVRSQTPSGKGIQRELMSDACGKNVVLPFALPVLNLKEDGLALRKLGCSYAMGPSFPQEIADELQTIINGSASKSMKNIPCDFTRPFDLRMLLPEKEQTPLNKVINDTFHR